MCPVCKKGMVVFEWEGVEIDRCVDCSGTWLDVGELDMIDQKAGTAAGRLSEMIRSGRSGERDTHACPRCSKKMRLLTLDSPRLDLDHCPRGCGLWFDRQELETLVSGAGDGETAAAARFLSDVFKKDLKA